MKKLLFGFAVLFYSTFAIAGTDIEGFWTTIDDETNQAKSVVQIYEYQGKFYGRVVELFKNKEARAKTAEKPLIKGLDIIWDLEKDGKKYKNGEILDPQKGKVYSCEIWRDGQNLIVRGKIAFLGRNQTWLPNKDFKTEENVDLTPKKPKIK